MKGEHKTMVKTINPVMEKAILSQIEKEAARVNGLNLSLLHDIEESLDLEGLVFMDLAQESELPQSDMTYVIIENGDYNNTTPEQLTFTENVTITFWSENRANPVLDRLTLLYLAKKNGLKVVASDNQNIILTNTSRVVNMFTLTCSRGVMVKGLC